MKKVLFALLFCTAFVCSICAQDVVYLNNGSVIKGKVLKQETSVIIVNPKGDTLEYPQARVREVRLQSTEVLPEKSSRKEYVHYSDLTKGFWMTTGLSAGLGSAGLDLKENMEITSLSFDLIGGYRFSQFFKIGLGISPGILKGNQVYEYNNFSLPVYLHLRGNIIDEEARMFSPVWGIDLGCDVTQSLGLYVAPMLGFRWGIRRHAVNAGVSFAFQQIQLAEPRTQEDIQNNSDPVVHETWCGKLLIKIGYEF